LLNYPRFSTTSEEHLSFNRKESVNAQSEYRHMSLEKCAFSIMGDIEELIVRSGKEIIIRLI